MYKNMGGFGGGNMQNLMRQAQKMQEQMQKQMAAADEELRNTTLTATSGGGMVEVHITGDKRVTDIVIKPEVVDPDDIEMLEDLIKAAINEAGKKVDEAKEGNMGDMGIPGGLF